MTHLQLSVIACPSLQPELEMLAAKCGSTISFQRLEMGLHERSADELRLALQLAIDQTEEGDAIAIGYGLCNRGVIGLKARHLPLVLPRSHDCIGILLGSSKRYLGELEKQPGTYFQSAGWLKCTRDARQPEFTFGPNSNVSYERLVSLYGEEAASYLSEQFEGFTRHYRRLAYIASPVDAASQWEQQARDIAAKRNWNYVRLEGDPSWLERLLTGAWNDDEFLIVRPGESVALTADDRLIEAA
jgi:hypothetical protein